MTTANSEQDRLFVSFWGTRGSISTPGRGTEKYGGNTPCLYLNHKNTHIIFDAGTGIRNLGIELGQAIAASSEPTELNLFLSHTHWDHIQGLPFFQPAYMKNVRLIIHGSPKKERFLEGVLAGQMDNDYFPVEMSALNSDVSVHEMTDERLSLGEVTISWQEQQLHPGGSVRYRVEVGDRKVVYATDVELDRIFGDNADDQEHAAMRKDYLDFVRDAELLIADGQYTEEEYRNCVGWGHTSIPTLLQTAYSANVKELAVFHHEPVHSDSFLDRLRETHAAEYRAKRPAMNVFWAREGLTMAI